MHLVAIAHKIMPSGVPDMATSISKLSASDRAKLLRNEREGAMPRRYI